MALFREQALAAHGTQWLGEIVLIRPLSFTVLTALAVALALGICGFLTWGSYTKHSTVSGQLVPDAGLVKVYVPQAGVVLEKRVREGQQVQAGDTLFVLSSERQSSTQGATQALISQSVTVREASLRDEMQKTRQLQLEEQSGLQKKIAGLQAELLKIDKQIAGQRDRVKLSETTLERYQGLLKQDFISKEQWQQKNEELLDQTARLASLERDQVSLSRELAVQQSEMAGLGLRQHNQMAQIGRALTSTGQELVESEAKRRLLITAPEAGVATAVIAEVGQAVDGNRPLVSIVPQGASLRAELYAPSRAVGFVKPGDKVQIRYQAYPYQKFGHQTGVVEAVSKTALPSQEFTTIGDAQGRASSEPLYRITVRLARQAVQAYGQPQALQAGMLLDADVLQERLRLYEWVLEPLYSLTGRL